MKNILESLVIRDNFTYSFDKKQIVLETVWQFLSHRSYWAAGVSEETVRTSIDHSVCLGVYTEDGSMAGFGRMITDKATFGYLADIFVLEEYRGRGISKQMVTLFCELAGQFQLRRLLLTTQDAHGLYAQLGFVPFPWPERLMFYRGHAGI